jgi:hypothetical protein
VWRKRGRRKKEGSVEEGGGRVKKEGSVEG